MHNHPYSHEHIDIFWSKQYWIELIPFHNKALPEIAIAKTLTHETQNTRLNARRPTFYQARSSVTNSTKVAQLESVIRRIVTTTWLDLLWSRGTSRVNVWR